MKKYTFLALAGIIALVGCSSTRVNLVDAGEISIEKGETPKVYIASPYAYNDGGMLHVSGRVHLKNNFSSYPDGHVDIAVLGPDGGLIEKASIPYSPTVVTTKPRRTVFEGAPFSVNLGKVPPSGGKVRITFHEVTRKANPKEFDCGDNEAVKGG